MIPTACVADAIACQCAGCATKRRNSRIARDASEKEYNFSILSGQSTISSGLHGPPPYRVPNQPDASATSSLLRIQNIPRINLDPALQAYFFKMQRMTLLTCHPEEIHYQADEISTSLQRGTSGVKAAARSLVFAGISNLENSRTVALIIYDIVVDLLWPPWNTRRELEEELLLEADNAFARSCCTASHCAIVLLTILTLQLQNQFRNDREGSGLQPLDNIREEIRTRMLNTSAFLGDLFALGLIPVVQMRSWVSVLHRSLDSITKCRALYLLLLRASQHIGDSLGDEFLLNIRSTIVSEAHKHPAIFPDGMRKRWLIVCSTSFSNTKLVLNDNLFQELCNVIDRTLAHDAEVARSGPPVVFHRWHQALSCDSSLFRAQDTWSYGILAN